jgi:hypothetical protein
MPGASAKVRGTLAQDPAYRPTLIRHHGEVSIEGFRRGQHVTVEIDGEQVDGVFDRQAEGHDGIDPETVPGGDVSAVGWVKLSDTGEIEGFLCRDIKPKPDADIRIAIGKAYEVMGDERRAATEAFAEDLRATVEVSVDLEVTERQPGRYGLTPIEWTSIFIGTTVATSLITNLTNDLYAKAKQLLLEQKAKGRHRRMGFVIYGPDGKELRRWDTGKNEQNKVENKTDGSVSRTPKHGLAASEIAVYSARGRDPEPVS